VNQDRASSPRPGGEAALHELIIRADNTLAVPRARIKVRHDLETTTPDPDDRRYNLIVRLVGGAVRAAWEHFLSAQTRTRLRAAFSSPLSGLGVAEPAARRYQISYGGYASVYIDGQRFGGMCGQPLTHGQRIDVEWPSLGDPLQTLRRLQGVTEARPAGEEMLHGTLCRRIVADDGTTEFTVWIDDEHIRQVQTVARDPFGTSTETLELRDFGGVPEPLDWTRFPRSH
jgi:hypothetical protein